MTEIDNNDQIKHQWYLTEIKIIILTINTLPFKNIFLKIIFMWIIFLWQITVIILYIYILGHLRGNANYFTNLQSRLINPWTHIKFEFFSWVSEMKDFRQKWSTWPWANRVNSPFLIDCQRLRVDLYHPPNPETFRIKCPNMAILGCSHNAALCPCFDKSTSYQHTQNTLTWRFSTQLQTDNSCPVVLHSLLSMDTKPSSRQPVIRT